jgi:hypothetical protein
VPHRHSTSSSDLSPRAIIEGPELGKTGNRSVVPCAPDSSNRKHSCSDGAATSIRAPFTVTRTNPSSPSARVTVRSGGCSFPSTNVNPRAGSTREINHSVPTRFQ